MIAVTHGINSSISLHKSYNDMGHFIPTHFVVNSDSWGWLDLQDYMAKKEFQNFKVESDDKFTVEQLEEIASLIKTGKELDFVETFGKPHLQYYSSIQRELKKSFGRLLWQYNQVNSTLDGWTRQVVSLGSNSHNAVNGYGMRRISWFERTVKVPILRIVCRGLNFLLTPKRKLEKRSWDRKLAAMLQQRKEQR